MKVLLNLCFTQHRALPQDPRLACSQRAWDLGAGGEGVGGGTLQETLHLSSHATPGPRLGHHPPLWLNTEPGRGRVSVSKAGQNFPASTQQHPALRCRVLRATLSQVSLMTQLKTRKRFISQPHGCSDPSLHLGETEAQKSAPPKAPKAARPERLALLSP